MKMNYDEIDKVSRHISKDLFTSTFIDDESIFTEISTLFYSAFSIKKLLVGGTAFVRPPALHNVIEFLNSLKRIEKEVIKYES